MKRTFAFAAILLFSVIVKTGFSHCQIPCGIYGDEGRFVTIDEHITTIEKSMNEINKIAKEGDKNYNQLVRWVNNKEQHADYISEIVTKYFLQQRVKPMASGANKSEAEYHKKLTLLHEMLVASMQAKQTTDLQHVKKLRELNAAFRDVYFSKSDQAHLNDHHKEADQKS